MWWQAKFAKNVAFGLLPFPGTIRALKRQFVSHPTTIAGWTLQEGLDQIEMIREAGFNLQSKTVLEIGTGWQPIIPLLYSLAGCSQVVMVDTQRLMDFPTFVGTVRNLADHATIIIATRMSLNQSETRETLSCVGVRSFQEALERFRLEYRAPFDLVSEHIPAASVDVVSSRAVLEHIPPNTLSSIMESVYRILRPGGLTCHFIDNSDHWSHSDQRLSRVNFLRYSDRTFSLMCRFNALDYQNRLRHYEYVSLLQEAGFKVICERAEPEPLAMEALKNLPVSKRFQRVPHVELSRLDSRIIAQKPTLQTERGND